MKKTTNIYFLIDCSVKSAYGINTQAYRAVIKADRALTCSKFPVNVQTHIIGITNGHSFSICSERSP